MQIALEQLLGERCYHMGELLGRLEHLPLWVEALEHPESADWSTLLAGYSATLDWPAVAVWETLAVRNPDALVLLSSRPADAWAASMRATILQVAQSPAPPGMDAWHGFVVRMLTRFAGGVLDLDHLARAYEAHNAHVRSVVPASRLVDWRLGDGWEPLCAALGVDVPVEPFPRTNDTAEFRARAGWD